MRFSFLKQEIKDGLSSQWLFSPILLLEIKKVADWATRQDPC